MNEKEDNQYDSSLTSTLLNNDINIDEGKKECNDLVVLPKALMRDIIGFGLLGSMNGILLAMYFTGTYLSFLNIPDDNIGTLVLSGSIGAAVGSALCAILVRQRPGIKVIVSVMFILVGGGLTWLPYPGNMVGVSIIFLGVGILHTIILALTAYKPESTTRAYQVGFASPGLFGTAIVVIAKAAIPSTVDGEADPYILKNALLSIGIVLPVLKALCFFFIVDHSPWSQANTTSTNDESINNTIDDSIDSNIKPPIPSSEFNDRPTDNKSKWLALRNMSWPYLTIWIVATTSHQVGGILDVSFCTSSLTYHGKEAQTGLNFIYLWTKVAVALLGAILAINAFGRWLRRLNPHWYWFPTIVNVIMVIVQCVALTTDSFPPVSPAVATIVLILRGASFYYINSYMPITLRGNPTKRLNKIYLEMQLQYLQAVTFLIMVIMAIIAVVSLTDEFVEGCKEHYEDVYPATECLVESSTMQVNAKNPYR